jgi:drug/metabolite transporter (DMT)-like permease
MKFSRFRGQDYVALLLAFALLVAVMGATISIIYATVHDERRTVTDSSTQLLTALFGGIIGILGAYIGTNGIHKDKDDDKKD